MMGMLRSCGGFGIVAGFVAFLALVTTAVSIAVALSGRSRAGSIVAGVGLLLVGTTSLTGFAGTLSGRAAVKSAAEVAGLGKSDQARILRQGSIEARDCARLGLLFSAVPFLVGLAGATIALFGGKKAEKDPEPLSPPETLDLGGAEASQDGPSVPIVLVGAAAAFTGLLASGGLGAASTGGSDYEPLVWSLMAASEAVVLAKPEERAARCAALEMALVGPMENPAARACGSRVDLDLSAVSGLANATEACMRDRVTAAATTPPHERAAIAKSAKCSATYACLPDGVRGSIAMQLAGLE